MKIDLSLTNELLYRGCKIESVAGRLNLTTPISEAVGIVGVNVAAMVAAVPASERGTVVLTGPMAVWAYLVVFRAVANAFSEVFYDDGRGHPVQHFKRHENFASPTHHSGIKKPRISRAIGLARRHPRRATTTGWPRPSS